MKYKVLLLSMVLVAALLIGCSDTGSSVEKVKLKQLGITLKDSSSDSGNATAYRNMYVEIDNSTRWEEINEIRFTDPNGTYWRYTKTSSPSLSDKWDSANQRFEFYNMYSSSYPNSIPLGDYLFEMTTESLGTFTYTFEVSSVTGQNTGSIDSQAGTGSNSQIMDIASGVNASLDTNDNLTVDFDPVDSSVEDGYLWLYDSIDNSSYIGFRGWFSNSQPLSDSSTNSYVYSVSEYSTAPQSLKVLLTATKEVNSQYRIFYRSISALIAITTP